jgi:hypothetical protein
VRDEDKVVVLMGDNLVIISWRTKQGADQKFVNTAGSITFAVRILHKSHVDAVDVVVKTKPINRPMETAEMREKFRAVANFSHPRLSDLDLQLPDNLRNVQDSHLHLSVFQLWDLLKSSKGFTSSHATLMKEVFENKFLKLCRGDIKEGILVCDGQLTRAIERSTILHPEKLQHLIQIPAGLHSLMGAVKSLGNHFIFLVLHLWPLQVEVFKRKNRTELCLATMTKESLDLILKKAVAEKFVENKVWAAKEAKVALLLVEGEGGGNGVTMDLDEQEDARDEENENGEEDENQENESILDELEDKDCEPSDKATDNIDLSDVQGWESEWSIEATKEGEAGMKKSKTSSKQDEFSIALKKLSNNSFIDDDDDDDDDDEDDQERGGDKQDVQEGDFTLRVFDADKWKHLLPFIYSLCAIGHYGPQINPPIKYTACFQQVYSYCIAFSELETELEAQVASSGSPGLALYFETLKEGLVETLMKPFENAVLTGSGRQFLEQYPRFLSLLALTKQPFCARASLRIQYSIQIWINERNDLLKLWLENHLALDDFFIEILNHLIATHVHANGEKTAESIIKASTLVAIFHAFRSALPVRTKKRDSHEGSDNVGVLLGSLSEEEEEAEEKEEYVKEMRAGSGEKHRIWTNPHTKESSKRTIRKIKSFMRAMAKAIVEASPNRGDDGVSWEDLAPLPDGGEAFINMKRVDFLGNGISVVSGMLERGAKAVVEVIDKFETYKEDVKKEEAAEAAEEAEKLLYTKAQLQLRRFLKLRMSLKILLFAYLLAHNHPTLGSKSVLIARILTVCPNIKDFASFFLKQKINRFNVAAFIAKFNGHVVPPIAPKKKEER